MVAGVGGGEGEAAGGGASLGDDTVVVVEDFLHKALAGDAHCHFIGRRSIYIFFFCTYLDRDVDADALVLLPHVRSVIPLLGGVVAHDERVLGELFVEALGRASVDVEVQGLRRSHKGCERKKGPHVGVRWVEGQLCSVS